MKTENSKAKIKTSNEFLGFGFLTVGIYLNEALRYFRTGCYDFYLSEHACTWDADILFAGINIGLLCWIYFLIPKIKNRALTRGQYLFMSSGFIVFFALPSLVDYFSSGCFATGPYRFYIFCGPTGHAFGLAAILLFFIWIRYFILEIRSRRRP
jgi:hypothetical protein